MSIIISIQGCHGVGKTTLLDNLKQQRPYYQFHSENLIEVDREKNKIPFSMDEETNFYKKQALYIRREINRFQLIKQGVIAVLDRGPEETEFYTLSYPKIHKKDWNIELNFADQLAQLRTCRSSNILYLSASTDVIWSRIKSDTKERPTADTWITKWQPHIDSYFRNHSKSKILETDYLTPQEVLEAALIWIDTLHSSHSS